MGRKSSHSSGQKEVPSLHWVGSGPLFLPVPGHLVLVSLDVMFIHLSYLQHWFGKDTVNGFSS